jgi:hypothetical protein
MRLHDWIYDIVCEICYDREYLYACYVRHFSALLKDILEQGLTADGGTYRIIGIKSNLAADFHWQLESRLNMMGLNVVTIRCSIENQDTKKKESEYIQSFELSAGESTTGKIKL